MRGDVFFIRTRVTPSSKSHWHIVLADEDEFLVVLAVITSKIDWHKEFARQSGCPEETIVEFPPEIYAPLRVASCVNCNAVFKISKKDFEDAKRAEGKRATCCPSFPEGFLLKIVKGVKASPVVSDAVKRLIWSAMRSD